MDSERLAQIESLFIAALEHDDEAAFLDEACAGDLALRDEVEALLGAHEDGQALAIEGRLLANEPLEVPDPDVLLGARIGAYRLTQLVGRGGMGEVYRAERDDDQYRQEVALKLVRPGFHTVDIVRRFRTERQILARLVHPNVARLLDGGMADDGRPYLVMEYVDGVPLTQFCDAGRLSVDDRLRLFRTVCAAVQFAHRNLVVHRDLKPSNILVTDEGQVKLLDFGIAKLLDPEAVDVSVALTRTEIRVMTPEYAAPEQVRGEAVTTATDVYALGVLLYELLTGHRPFRLTSRLQAEIERIICEEEPTRPSTAVTKAQEVRGHDGTTATLTPERVSAARRTPIGRLRRLLQGDLDNIVMMALRKEPERRYASAGQLEEDIGRFLEGRTVIAQKDTLRYRARTFIRRNRVGVAVAMAFVLLLLGFSAVTAWQAQTVARQRDTARAERDKAEQVVQILVSLFETTDPTKVPGGDTLRVGAFLERSEAVIDDLADQPETQAQMQHVLGTMYMARSQFDRARPLLEKAWARQQALNGPDDPAALATFHSLAQLTQASGDLETARPMFVESLTRHRRVYGDVHVSVAQSMQNLATLTEDEEEKERLLRETLAMRRTLLPEVSEGMAASLNELGRHQYDKKNYEGAIQYWREALDILTQLRGEEHPHSLTVMGNLAAAYSTTNRLEEAEAMQRRALALRRVVLGPETVPVANGLSILGNILSRKGDHAGAEASFRGAYALWDKIVGQDHWRTANDARNLARSLQYQRRYDEALPYLQEAIAIYTRARGAESRPVGYLRGQLGLLLLDRGQADEALHTVREALSIIEAQTLEGGHYTLADAQVWLGAILLEKNLPQEAEPPLREALAFRQSTLRTDDPKVAEARCVLGRALARQGRYAEAEPLLYEGFSRFAAWGLAPPNAIEQTRRLLIETYTALGEPDKVALYR